MLYGNIHGEELWLKDNWQRDFAKEFYTVNLPFFYLANKKKKCFGEGKKSVEYEDGTVSYLDGRIVSDGVTLKDKDFARL